MDGSRRRVLAAVAGLVVGGGVAGIGIVENADPAASALLGVVFAVATGLSVDRWSLLRGAGDWAGAMVVLVLACANAGVYWLVGSPDPLVSLLVVGTGYTAYLFGLAGGTPGTDDVDVSAT